MTQPDATTPIARTAEDARYRPIPGDTYNYPAPYENDVDTVIRVDGDKVTLRDADGDFLSVTLEDWGRFPGYWTPAAATP